MTSTEPVFFADRASWRKWLEQNHDRQREVWILTYKVRTGKRCLSYSDALDEALCYGWIDSRMRRIDDEKHMWRFAPRRPESIWSLNNRRRVEELVKEGRMTPHGIAKVDAAKKSGEWDKATAPSSPPQLPDDLKAALGKDSIAWKNFNGLARSYRTQYIYWVMAAKRPETRKRRIDEVVKRTKRSKKMYPR